ncbi:MAG: HAMP domain-containing sensor histidine kinase [Chloroflexota bacterium]
MSIRLRLTVLYSVILAATLGVFSIALYLTLSYSTRAFMENTLGAEMQRLEAANERMQSFAPPKWPANSVGSGETYWQACDEKGNVMGRTENLRDHTLPLSDEGLKKVQSGLSLYEVTRINDVPLLVFSKQVHNDNGNGILQVARSIAEQEQALLTLRTALLIGSSITLLIAVSGGWLLAGASLRPIDQLTRTAQMIGSERNFQRRVTYKGPQDEVGRLATTFNHMLSALEAGYQQVAQALEAQRAFIADASHELRTPLTTLRGNLALLQREPPITTDDRRAVMTDIVDENERMIRLVNDLMTLARADYAPPISIESVSLPSLMAEVERQIHGLRPACSLCVTRAPDVEVVGRRDLLKQVLLILVDNAVKFTPTDGKVELGAEVRGDTVIIRVRDTGIGIPQAQLPHIFQRFYRIDPSRSGNGYGLGLAIAKTLVEKMSGTIRAESEPGKGSLFTITLPARAIPVRANLRAIPAYSYAKG